MHWYYSIDLPIFRGSNCAKITLALIAPRGKRGFMVTTAQFVSLEHRAVSLTATWALCRQLMAGRDPRWLSFPTQLSQERLGFLLTCATFAARAAFVKERD